MMSSAGILIVFIIPVIVTAVISLLVGFEWKPALLIFTGWLIVVMVLACIIITGDWEDTDLILLLIGIITSDVGVIKLTSEPK